MRERAAPVAAETSSNKQIVPDRISIWIVAG